MRMAVASISVVLLLSGIAAPFGVAQETVKETLRVRGSDSMAAMVDSYAHEFMKSHPDSNIIVSGGQDISFDALANKEADIIMASRRINSEELEVLKRKGTRVEGKIVGWGGIVIIVNPQNPMNELTESQVVRIFSGKVTNWKELGGPEKPIEVLTVGEQRGGALQYFGKDFLKAPFAPNAVTKAYFRSIISDVADAEPDISFVRVRNILQLASQGLEKKVKIVAIKKDEGSPAVMPSRETCNKGTYPISRPYFMYIDENAGSKLAKDFFAFCVSKNPRGE